MPAINKRGLFLGAAAVGAAIASELKKPAEERTWHGKIAGVVPYDLRRPTADSVREKLWNPTGGFWSPSVFGVGWTPNLGRLAAQTGLLGQDQAASPAVDETGPAAQPAAAPELPAAADSEPDDV